MCLYIQYSATNNVLIYGGMYVYSLDSANNIILIIGGMCILYGFVLVKLRKFNKTLMFCYT